eukprot:snap_masked-scaffold_5-processed-gene-14.29-mRNA-1 protein AED:1.00 eAED:1.00 QI:0/0/0/0/1/1/3/0/946
MVFKYNKVKIPLFDLKCYPTAANTGVFPSGSVLAVGGGGKASTGVKNGICVLNPKENKDLELIHVFETPDGVPEDIDISSCGKFVCCTLNGVIQIYLLRKMDSSLAYTYENNTEFIFDSFSQKNVAPVVPCLQLVCNISISNQSQVQLSQPKFLNPLTQNKKNESPGIQPQHLRADSSCLQIVTGAENGTIRFWRILDPVSIEASDLHLLSVVSAHSKRITKVVPGNMKNEVVATISEDKTCRIWDVADLKKPKLMLILPENIEKSLVIRTVTILRNSLIAVYIPKRKGDSVILHLTRTSSSDIFQPSNRVRLPRKRITCASKKSRDNLLFLGSADGEVVVIDLLSFSILKTYKKVHALPITSIDSCMHAQQEWIFCASCDTWASYAQVPRRQGFFSPRKLVFNSFTSFLLFFLVGYLGSLYSVEHMLKSIGLDLNKETIKQKVADEFDFDSGFDEESYAREDENFSAFESEFECEDEHVHEAMQQEKEYEREKTTPLKEFIDDEEEEDYNLETEVGSVETEPLDELIELHEPPTLNDVDIIAEERIHPNIELEKDYPIGVDEVIDKESILSTFGAAETEAATLGMSAEEKEVSDESDSFKKLNIQETLELVTDKTTIDAAPDELQEEREFEEASDFLNEKNIENILVDETENSVVDAGQEEQDDVSAKITETGEGEGGCVEQTSTLSTVEKLQIIDNEEGDLSVAVETDGKVEIVSLIEDSDTENLDNVFSLLEEASITESAKRSREIKTNDSETIEGSTETEPRGVAVDARGNVLKEVLNEIADFAPFEDNAEEEITLENEEINLIEKLDQYEASALVDILEEKATDRDEEQLDLPGEVVLDSILINKKTDSDLILRDQEADDSFLDAVEEKQAGREEREEIVSHLHDTVAEANLDQEVAELKNNANDDIVLSKEEIELWTVIKDAQLSEEDTDDVSVSMNSEL